MAVHRGKENVAVELIVEHQVFLMIWVILIANTHDAVRLPLVKHMYTGLTHWWNAKDKSRRSIVTMLLVVCSGTNVVCMH
jgi:hypothetical protein